MRPPETKLVDSVSLPEMSRGVWTQTGDRVYMVSSHDELVGVDTRSLRRGGLIALQHGVVALAATPSGDRLYVATDSTSSIAVVDRYRDRITTRIELSGQPRDLRVDPFGRYLLVRAARGDSVQIIAVGTDQLIGTVRSAWRADLPFVAPDGALALAQGADVVFVDGATRRERSRTIRGADDFWYPFQWTGFRPRSAALDQPVSFTRPDTTDSAARVGTPPADTTARPAAPRDTTAHGFIVSFAALLSETRARDLATQIKVRGQNARIVATEREGTTIYRVLLGPYPTREEADRVGRESGQTYWVYEGAP